MFMSPLADGPLKFVDSLDGTSTNVEHVTKFGRSFSVVKVPYVFKLFMQELQAINVKMAIITEDNVDQFDNMNFSRNISLLTNGKGLHEIMDEVSNVINKENNKPRKMYDELLSSEEEPVYAPNSPIYAPIYVQNSPEYVPVSREFSPVSPEFSPKSPEFSPKYAPNSPLYAPNSPPVSPEYARKSHDWENPSLFEYEQKPWIIEDEGKGQGQGTSYQPTDIVVFNGDFKPNRAWEINKFEKGFAILETTDIEGLLPNTNRGTHIKVAALSDIRKYVPQMSQGGLSHGLSQGGFSQGLSHGGFSQGLSPQGLPHGGLSQGQPVVVNVITGDNNSMETSEPQKQDVDFSKPQIKFVESENNGKTVDSLLLGGNSKSIVVKKV